VHTLYYTIKSDGNNYKTPVYFVNKSRQQVKKQKLFNNIVCAVCA